MDKRERMIQNIQAEPDQAIRIMKMVIYIAESASEEVKNIIEEMLDRLLRKDGTVVSICANARMKLENIHDAG